MNKLDNLFLFDEKGHEFWIEIERKYNVLYNTIEYLLPHIKNEINVYALKYVKHASRLIILSLETIDNY